MPQKFELEELLNIYNNAPVGQHSLNSDGLFIHINDTELRWLGYDREEIIGKKYLIDVLDEKSKILFKEKFPIFLKQGHIENCEFTLVSKGGATIPVLISAAAVKDDAGNFLYSSSALTDISHFKNTLRDERERLLTILNTVSDPIFLKDNDHRIVIANDAFYEIFGLKEETVIGKTLAENVPENERKSFLAIDRDVLDTGKPNINEETLTTAGRATRFIVTKKVRFVDNFGNRFIVGSIHDITDHRIAEAKLRLKIEEVEKMNSFMVDRELKMVTLKQELASLKNKQNLE